MLNIDSETADDLLDALKNIASSFRHIASKTANADSRTTLLDGSVQLRFVRRQNLLNPDLNELAQWFTAASLTLKQHRQRISAPSTPTPRPAHQHVGAKA